MTDKLEFPYAILEDMNMRSVLLVLAVALSLVACRAGLQLRTGDTLFRTLPGSEFILHADIIIPPGQLRASFQGGKLLNGASEFEPRCELELRDFSEEPQTIHAGTYTIEKVRGLDRYVARPAENIQLAAAGVLQLGTGTDSQWYMRTYHMTLLSDAYHMTLLSDGHEEVPALICGGAYNYAFYVRYPDLQDILAALGEFATLKIH
jgi:hypothetical protein